MKSCKYCGRENENTTVCCRECGMPFVDPPAAPPPQEPGTEETESLRSTLSVLGVKRLWFVCFLGLVVLAFIAALFLWRHPRAANAPRIVVLATWYSNGEQLVTFSPDPPGTEIAYADLVSVSDDGNTQPPTVRSFGHVIPVHNPTQTNYTLRFVAIPKRGASMGGKPLAYTPGSYTVAYTPSENAHRVRVGVAFEQKGVGDYIQRLRNSWQQKTPVLLMVKSYQDPVFVTTEPITNGTTRTNSPR